jgi:glyoxylase-like metal-dependent hydrolase (beta-lactamase superfamily II)
MFSGTMNLQIIPGGPIQTNGYLLTEPANGQAVLIDAPEGVWPAVERQLTKDGCKLTGLWLTHGHWDHTQGAADIMRRTGARASGHRDDQVLFEEPAAMAAFMRGVVLEAVKIDAWLEPGQQMQAMGVPVEVRHVPGHSLGNVLFYFPTLKAAFVGDALFKGAVGRTDLPGGDFAVLERSIREQIYSLPPDTTVYPGHGPATTVAHEMATNPFVIPA